ncbi:MAG: hypothetical protein K2W94_01235 [Alphaproteobacteria bacterium]|nr:hypothetical protein [Alphaproteobacteria bacterium]
MRFLVKVAIVSVIVLFSICSESKAMDDYEPLGDQGLTVAFMRKHLPSASNYIDGLLKGFSVPSSDGKSRRSDKVTLLWCKPEETSRLFSEIKARLGLGPKDSVRIELFRASAEVAMYCIY